MNVKARRDVDSGRGGSPVAFWVDQSGAGNHALQDLQTFQPVALENAIITNKPTVGFFTTNYFYLRFHASLTWTQAEAMAVFRVHSGQPAVQRKHWRLGNGLAEYPSVSLSNAVHDHFFRENNTNSTVGAPITLTNFHLYSVQATSNSWSSSFNGTSYLTVSPNTFLVAPTANLGAGGNTRPWDGEMAEFMIFNRVLSSGERTAVQEYLNRRHLLW